MAFLRAGSLDSDNAPVLRKSIFTASITVTEKDSVKLVSGFSSLGTTGVEVFGHVDAIQTFTGVGQTTTGVAGASSGSFVGTFLVPASNTTGAKESGLIDISKLSLYSVDPDATIGTNTGSDLNGYHTDLADEDNTDENTAATTTAQYYIWGVDPKDSGNQIVSIFESVVFGPLS